jgi:hypothetical protein
MIAWSLGGAYWVHMVERDLGTDARVALRKCT